MNSPRATSPSVTRAITPYRVVVSLLLAAAVVGVGWAFTEHREVEPLIVRDAAVALVEPGEGEQALRQDRIFVQLDPAYTGVLFVNGVEIPADQINRAAGVHTLEYVPGPDSETGPLPAGLNRATVEFWELSRTRAASRSYSWSFNVT